MAIFDYQTQGNMAEAIEKHYEVIAKTLHDSFVKGDLDLIKAFGRPFPFNKILDLGVMIEEKSDCVKQELELKKKLSLEIGQSRKQDRFFDLCRFIIHDWGGIRTFNVDTKRAIIDSFLGECDKEEKNVSFDYISSLSKVAAFYRPADNFIYDSRVAYSLNWILLSKDYDGPFFPIPDSQVKAIRDYDLPTILRLKTKKDKDIFIDKRKAYSIYCSLIKGVYSSLKKKEGSIIKKYEKDMEEYPCLVEMMLYAYARTAVDAIQKLVSVEIKKNNS